MHDYSAKLVDNASTALFNLNDRTFIKPTNETSTVSKEKLEKAEAKLREKQERRAKDGATNGDTRQAARLEEAVVSQATNKKLLTDNDNTDGSNKSYDIHIDNFDVSYGNKYVRQYIIYSK